ncbi:MAG: helix-turn-helix transcriptional regulator [Bacteroidetes Order II. Incertae sedis bacterium]|nr:helix-turn-helix transcriptional regulator [Bacteroidetes Order II. bacterium]
MAGFQNLPLMNDAKGLSQEYMAERLGISKNAYGKIERGETKPNFHRLEQIATALELSLEQLLHGQVVIYNKNQVKEGNSNFQTFSSSSGQELALLQQENAHLKEKIAWLERENALQQQLLAQFQAQA